ncbi:GNAT family N-acetyltransferase [Deinococcus fonticola]|uniref:GNAT family N-acetyltransferase n=1 Tax=Deinococcus fonticola TaxID=2528713 RepID=UPI001074B494|nr:GNAT family protein [Deinococcus fonticola]
MTTLSTLRLTVRPLTPEDLPALVTYRNDPEVARYQGWTLPYTPVMAQGLLSDNPLGMEGWVQRAIALKNGELIGDLALNRRGPQAEFGVTLSRHAQGHGYASEAIRALLHFAFHELNLHRVHASIDPRNQAIAGLLRHVGFRHEGTHLKSYCLRGEWTDDAIYAVLSEEWRA